MKCDLHLVRAAVLSGLLLAMLGACYGSLSLGDRLGDEYIQKGEWLKAVLELRKAVQKNPGDTEAKLRLHQLELEAASHYYQGGMKFVARDNLDAAIAQFQQGLAVMPTNDKLIGAMESALARKEADSLSSEGSRQLAAGNLDAAIQSFERALEIYPRHKAAALHLSRIRKESEKASASQFALLSTEPIVLRFRQTPIRTAFEFVTKSFGINMIFDEGVQNAPITLFAENVSFDQALNLLTATSNTFYKKIGLNTILIAPDTQDKRGQYEDQIVRTFQLNTIKAKEMAGILKGVVAPKKIIINETLNTLIVRDTEEVINLAERLILLNDRKPAETIVDVEILEVNRTKAERLGFDLGSEITARFDEFPVSSSFRSALQTGTVTLPSITFRYFKQDVDAKTLANPQIRTINGKAAKIHIGDRVPLRSSTIQDSTGQTRTTFVYTDIGILLLVETTVHIDNSVSVKLKLEVSTLGQNLGTPDEPAFAIGTRNAETTMILRDGETAILGGLIRDEERNAMVKVPGLGSIPVLGLFFRSSDNSVGRTDVLLTITPRVLRPWDLPSKADLQFFSGNANRYSDKALFAYLGKSPKGRSRRLPRIVLGDSSAGPATTPGAAPAPAQAPPGAPSPVFPKPAQPLFTFSKPVYESGVGQEFEIELLGTDLRETASLSAEVLFNPDLVEFERGEQGPAYVDAFTTEVDKAKGVLRIQVKLARGTRLEGKTVLGKVVLRGKKPGVSYLLYRTPKLEDASGEAIDAQIRASRVIIK